LVKLTINQVLQQGVEAHKAGQVQEAHRLYAAILKVQPKHPDANHNTGLLTVGFGEIELALPYFETALEANPNIAQFWYSHIVALIKLERLIEAKALLDQAKGKGIKGADFDQLEQKLNDAYKALSIRPDSADAYYNMGVTLQKQGKLEGAIEAYNKAIALQPDYADAYYNMGIALQEQGKLEEAIDAYNKASAIKPNYVKAYNNMGVTLQEQGKLEEAIEAYNKALALQPDYAEAYNNMGNAFKDQGKPEEAIEACNKAIALQPDYAEAYNNMGNAFKDQGKLEEAIESYKKAIALQPDYAEAYNNMGNAFKDQGKLEEAIESYNKASAIKPDYANAYNNMGVTLQEQNKLEEAIEAYNKALVIKPDYVKAYKNMATALQEQNKLEEAIEACNKALVIKPDYEAARTLKLHQQAHICNWESIAEDVHLIPELGTSENDVPPFALLPLEDAPERHLARSKVYAKVNYPQKPLPPKVRPSQIPKRLRIGYFSADFHSHATMYLMLQIFAAHDRTRFKVYAYSYGPDRHDEMRIALIANVDQFNDVREMNDMEIFELARSDNLDIAIDLKGYTKDMRLSPFANGLAPVQISYLGYPGTLGTDFIDYIIADPILIPEGKRQYYSEQIIYLPNTYQPTDNTRAISGKVITRENMGLPSDGFVFCCFNNNYKISPKEFDIWMCLLNKVEGSVLWLLKSNKWAECYLKKEAKARGISGDRLIFAEKLVNSEHLARHSLADLFLDTFNVNAHTTATDALWAGLPVVTKVGLGFAARVAGSLLNAVGLPELITETEKDYEALILELATNPKKLSEVKEKLANNRLTQPLFNTELYTKHLENGYQQAYQNYFDGNLPQTIIVPK
jgi:predicted O-linked N-acetylglucosamine transferase (SPINDLY family)